MIGDFRHRPVMLDKVVELFGPVPAGILVDMTVGGGGHARALLESRPDCRLLGIDRDRDALAAASDVLSSFGDRVTLRHARFDRLASIMTELQIPSTSGVLFDLGVSSPQLDRAERGFSYRHDGPLDMRMDRDEQWTAADIVNTYTEAELTRVLRVHSEERFADRIARAIVAARPIETTVELAAIVRDAIPAPARRRGGHPAKRTFQAIRIEVNAETSILGDAIDTAVDTMTPGGRIAVLAYHSGEDRIVKDRLRQQATGGCTCPADLPCVCDAVHTVRLLRAGAWKATPDEAVANPRAESVRLRAAEKLPA